MIQIEIPKQKSTRFEVVAWPSGYGILPEPGSLLDQDAFTMMMFERFISGERTAAIKKVSK